MLPIGGIEVAPERPAGLFVMVDSINLATFEALFFLLPLIFRFCRKSPPVFGTLISVVTVI